MKLPRYKYVYDRRRTATSSKKAAVEFVVSYNYVQKYVTTGLMLYPQEWNTKLGMVIKREDAVAKNKMLRLFWEKAESILLDMVENECVDLEDFVRLMQNRGEDNAPTFLNYVRARAKAKPVRETTRKRYTSFLNVLEKFRTNIKFSEINVKFIRDYDEWLHNRNIGTESCPKRMEQCTIATHHKYMKQFLNDAVIDGHIAKNPYSDRSIKIDKGEKEYVDYVDEEKLKEIQELALSAPSLERARDLFLMQAFTGLSYSDLMEFDIKKATKVSSGNFMYIGHRHKTGVEFILFLLPEALKILKKYDNKVPQLSNQKYNEYLKVIGMSVGVPGLHSHQARGTFATVAINRGVSLEILKKVLGHTKAIQTAHYATILQGTIEKEMEKMK